MAIVPIFQPSERLRGVHQQGMTTQATGEDFGAAKGRGLEALAKGVGTIADVVAKLKAREDETVAKERDNALAEEVRRLVHDPESGFLSKRGKKAVEAWPAFNKNVQKAADKSRNGLSGDQAGLYDPAAGARAKAAVQLGEGHVWQAEKDWASDASLLRIAGFQADALAVFSDPQAVEKYIVLGMREIDTLAEHQGWDAEKAKERKRELISDIRVDGVRKMLAQDPFEAEKNLQRYGGQIASGALKHVSDEVTEGVLDAKATQEVNRIIDKQGSGVVIGVRGVAGPRVLAGGELAMRMIRDRTEFRPQPYLVGDEMRAGFGSNTVTRRDGTVAFVTPGMVVSQEDAARDLSRRLGELQINLAKDIGDAAWRALAPNSQAALTSVAYDYGGLPENVAMAARSGDAEAIATAISALGDDDGGIDSSRRSNEAAVARGRMQSGEGLSYAETEQELAGISDPEVSKRARAFLERHNGLKEKQQSESQRQDMAEIYSLIDGGTTPDKIAPALRVRVGEQAMKNVESYFQQRLRRGEPETDMLLLHQLERVAAQDPLSFAARSLFDYRHRLDDAAYRRLKGIQEAVRKDPVGANSLSVVYDEGYRQIDGILAKLGIAPMDGRKTKATPHSLMIARVYRGLSDSCQDYIKDNNGRKPNAAEIQQMVEREVAVFLRQVPAGVIISNVEYQNIPKEKRDEFTRSLKDENNGRYATKEEVAAAYNRWLTNSRGQQAQGSH